MQTVKPTSRFTIATHPNHFLPNEFSEKPISQAKGALTQKFRSWDDYSTASSSKTPFKAPSSVPSEAEIMKALGISRSASSSLVLTNFDPCDGTAQIPMWMFVDDFKKIRSMKVKPIPKQHRVEGSSGWEVRDISDRGQGLFTTRSYKAGETILMERPIQMTTIVFGTTPTVSMDEVAEALFDRQTPENQKKFLSLSNCKSSEEAGLHMGILRTNQNHCYLFSDEENTGGVFPTISKCNHSCSPNVSWNFFPEYLAMKLTANCDLPAGIEMVACYIDGVTKPRAARQAELLQKYKFTCACPACDVTPQEWMKSDNRRAELARMESSDGSVYNWLMYGTPSDNLFIKNQHRGMDLATKEGLHKYVGRYAHALALGYCAIGMAKDSKNWAIIALAKGEKLESDEAYSLKQMSVDPTRDKTWLLRTRQKLAQQPGIQRRNIGVSRGDALPYIPAHVPVVRLSDEAGAYFNQQLASVKGKAAKNKMRNKLMRELKGEDGYTMAEAFGAILGDK